MKSLSLSVCKKKHWTNRFKTLIFVRGEFRTKNMLPNLLGKLKTPNLVRGCQYQFWLLLKCPTVVMIYDSRSTVMAMNLVMWAHPKGYMDVNIIYREPPKLWKKGVFAT